VDADGSWVGVEVGNGSTGVGVSERAGAQGISIVLLSNTMKVNTSAMFAVEAESGIV
jgi:hypothetical protein